MERPYGRFYNIPKILSEKGHKAFVLLLDYKNSPEEVREISGMQWQSIGSGASSLFQYVSEANNLVEKSGIDCVVGFSDIWFGILAERIARKNNIPFVMDAYDNYESYIPWLLPLHWMWRRVLRRASITTVAGPSLKDLFLSYGLEKSPVVVPMAADSLFYPQDMIASRKALGLPLDKKLVGYCGKIVRKKKAGDIYRIAESFKDDDDVMFVISGDNSQIPDHCKNIINLGYIADALMPALVNSLDIMLVLNRGSSFGSYSYPVKLCEAMRCNVTPVAARVAGASWMLRDYPECLVRAGDIEDYKKTILSLLDTKKEYIDHNNWENSSDIFERCLIDM